MSGNKNSIVICVLVLYLAGLTGCAAGWFLAGAGTAATVAAIAQKNNSQDQEDIK